MYPTSLQLLIDDPDWYIWRTSSKARQSTPTSVSFLIARIAASDATWNWTGWMPFLWHFLNSLGEIGRAESTTSTSPAQKSLNPAFSLVLVMSTREAPPPLS